MGDIRISPCLSDCMHGGFVKVGTPRGPHPIPLLPIAFPPLPFLGGRFFLWFLELQTGRRGKETPTRSCSKYRRAHGTRKRCREEGAPLIHRADLKREREGALSSRSLWVSLSPLAHCLLCLLPFCLHDGSVSSIISFVIAPSFLMPQITIVTFCCSAEMERAGEGAP